MKSMNKILSLAVIAGILLVGCGKEKTKEIVTEEAKYEVHSLDSLVLGYVVQIVKYDTLLMLSEAGKPYMIETFDSRGLSLCDSMGYVGHGHGEMTPPVTLINMGDSMLVYSRPTFSMAILKPDGMLDFRYRMPNEVSNVYDFVDGNTVASGMYTDGTRFAVFDGNGQQVMSFGQYPNMSASDNIDNNAIKGMFHQTRGIVTSSSKRAMAAITGNVLSIYKEDNGKWALHKEILLAPYKYTGNATETILKAKMDQGYKAPYVAICGNGGHIYLMRKYDKEAEQTIIETYDWEGELQARHSIPLVIDKYALYNANSIIGYSSDPDQSFVIIDL